MVNSGLWRTEMPSLRKLRLISNTRSKAAHQQALEVQLRRDAQEHLLIQRVVVRLERLGVGATRDRVQHRRLDLQEIVRHHELCGCR
jgi:hypothetical protein